MTHSQMTIFLDRAMKKKIFSRIENLYQFMVAVGVNADVTMIIDVNEEVTMIELFSLFEKYYFVFKINYMLEY